MKKQTPRLLKSAALAASLSLVPLTQIFAQEADDLAPFENLMAYEVLGEAAGMKIVGLTISDVLSLTDHDMALLKVTPRQVEETPEHVAGLKLRAYLQASGHGEWVEKFDASYHEKKQTEGISTIEIEAHKGEPYADFLTQLYQQDTRAWPLAIPSSGATWMPASLAQDSADELCLVADMQQGEPSAHFALRIFLDVLNHCAQEYAGSIRVDGLVLKPGAMKSFIEKTLMNGVTEAELDAYVAYSFNYSPAKGMETFTTYYQALSNRMSQTDAEHILTEALDFDAELQSTDAGTRYKIMSDTIKDDSGVKAAWAQTHKLYLSQHGVVFEDAPETPISALIQRATTTSPKKDLLAPAM